MQTAIKTRGMVHFGEFELDAAAGQLYRKGAKLRLQEQPSQILQILLQRPGEVVTREELQQKIWPSDTFVDFDHGINNAIKRLREDRKSIRLNSSHQIISYAVFCLKKKKKKKK